VFSTLHHTQKTFSALLLATLLLIHSVKLLHSHTYSHFLAKPANSKALPDTKHQSGFFNAISHCAVCFYQIQKDADDYFFPISKIHTYKTGQVLDLISASEKTYYYSATESRGPPRIS